MKTSCGTSLKVSQCVKETGLPRAYELHVHHDIYKHTSSRKDSLQLPYYYLS